MSLTKLEEVREKFKDHCNFYADSIRLKQRDNTVDDYTAITMHYEKFAKENHKQSISGDDDWGPYQRKPTREHVSVALV